MQRLILVARCRQVYRDSHTPELPLRTQLIEFPLEPRPRDERVNYSKHTAIR